MFTRPGIISISHQRSKPAQHLPHERLGAVHARGGTCLVAMEGFSIEHRGVITIFKFGKPSNFLWAMASMAMLNHQRVVDSKVEHVGFTSSRIKMGESMPAIYSHPFGYPIGRASPIKFLRYSATKKDALLHGLINQHQWHPKNHGAVDTAGLCPKKHGLIEEEILYLVGKAMSSFSCHFTHNNQWPFQEPKLELPTIYKAYVLGLNFRGYSPNFYGQTYGTNIPPFLGS